MHEYDEASLAVDCEGKSRKFQTLNFLGLSFIMRLLHILYLITSAIYFISFESTKSQVTLSFSLKTSLPDLLERKVFPIQNDSKSLLNKNLIEKKS